MRRNQSTGHLKTERKKKYKSSLEKRTAARASKIFLTQCPASNKNYQTCKSTKRLKIKGGGEGGGNPEKIIRQ